MTAVGRRQLLITAAAGAAALVTMIALTDPIFLGRLGNGRSPSDPPPAAS